MATNYFTTFLQNVDIAILLLIFMLEIQTILQKNLQTTDVLGNY